MKTTTDPLSPSLRTKKRSQEESSAPFKKGALHSSADEQMIKKKKRKLEGEEEVLVSSPLADEQMIEKKKVVEEEEVLISSPLPPPAYEQMNIKKKKKKRKLLGEEEVLVSSPPPADEQMKIKKKKKKRKLLGEEEVLVSSPPPADEQMKIKKKKKRKLLGEEEVLVSSPPADEQMIEKKKKRKLVGEEEVLVSSPPADEQMIKKMMVGEEEVLISSSLLLPAYEQMKIKKKRRRKLVGEEEVLVSSPLAADEQMKKIKKKKKAGLVGVSPVEEEETVSPASVSHSNSMVPMETNISKNKTKEKPQRVAMATKNTQVVWETHVKEGEGGETRRNGGVKEQNGEEKRTTSAGADGFDRKLLAELREFIPDVENRSANRISKLLQYDLQRFRDFKRRGMSLHYGRFSKDENEIIRQNISDFLALTGISSAIKLLFPKRFKEEEKHIRTLKARHHFLERIAENVPRSCEQVYIRAKKMFDDTNHMGRFSKDELCSLVKLQKIHGNNWKTISEKMDRSVYALEKRFVTLVSGQGLWTPDEEVRLKTAIRKHLETRFQQGPGSGLTRKQLCNNLPWKDISRLVQTRSWVQCRMKWFSILKSRMSSRGSVFNRRPEGIQAKILLINTEVTTVSTQKMFHTLKVSKVPNWSQLSYGDIIDFLQLHIVPTLQDKLRRCSQTETQREALQEEEEEEEERRYDLSNIFAPDAEDWEEVDNS
ncbi:uncharacterized protein KZ484_003413 isoform 2-T2 [Pholidichthys leucotaenia]